MYLKLYFLWLDGLALVAPASIHADLAVLSLEARLTRHF